MFDCDWLRTVRAGLRRTSLRRKVTRETKNMNLKKISIAVTTLALVAGAVCGPLAAANAQSRQTDKNNMRNIGIGAGAGALYELSKGKGTNALILGAGAAYAGKKYEDDRKAQSKASSARAAARHRAALHAAWLRKHHKHS